MNHILILDIGKTNKKCFVFDEHYNISYEHSSTLPETVDDDGDPCEDLEALKNWVLRTLLNILENENFQIRAINITTYGASLVHLDTAKNPILPLYNYLKPFPAKLKKQFFEKYGHEAKIALETASPILGNLNSGLQLYEIKHRKPLVFNQIKQTLHLPQYIAMLIHGVAASEITSIGCHTLLWNFTENAYHNWVKSAGFITKFPPILPAGQAMQTAIPVSIGDNYQAFAAGIGIHDSSAALIPYLVTFSAPFVLISTGTWCISLNPFNTDPLTPNELLQDCLCYLNYQGKPVKAARFFGGHEHELAVKEIAAKFQVPEDFYKYVEITDNRPEGMAYCDFMQTLMEKQRASTSLAIGNSPVRQIYVDGGFSKNKVFMKLLADAFPAMKVCAAEIAQATALGAAIAIHQSWNQNPLPVNLISLNKF